MLIFLHVVYIHAFLLLHKQTSGESPVNTALIPGIPGNGPTQQSGDVAVWSDSDGKVEESPCRADCVLVTHEVNWDEAYTQLVPVVVMVVLQLWAVLGSSHHPISMPEGSGVSEAVAALAEVHARARVTSATTAFGTAAPVDVGLTSRAFVSCRA